MLAPNNSFKGTAHRGARSKRHCIMLCPRPAVGGPLTQALGAMAMESQSEKKSYQEIAALTLSGYQLIEAMLKTYLRNYFNIAKHRVGADFYFGFSGDDYKNAALGTLLKAFSKTCSDSALVKDLQAELPRRDHVAHQAMLVLYKRQPCSSEELRELAAELSARSESIASLLNRLNALHSCLVAPYQKDAGVGA